MEHLINKTATASTVVDGSNTAATVGSGSLAVFGTPMMVALMEKAACNCLAEALTEGQTSVGTVVNIEHIAASPVGAAIAAKATVTAVDGRKVEFALEAHEIGENNKKIGFGTHTRFVVDSERFMAKLKKK